MTTKPKDEDGSCAAARKAIENKDFVGWRGLPGCTGGELFAGFPADLSGRPTRHLGSSASSAAFVLLELPGYYRPMANVRDGKLVLVDGMNPEIGEALPALLTDLGEPNAKLDWVFGTLPFSEREWVYAERGISLFLNTEHDKALHIALYSATDLDTYLKDVRPPLAKKRLPKK